MSKNLPQFTIRQLLEVGAHFGHKTMRRNPKMSKYIYTNRNGISIIDLNKTAVLLQNALKTVKEVAKNNGRILFVSTKKQAIDIVADSATRCGQYYVNFRWLGGMLTNWKTVSKSIKTLREVEAKLSDDEIGYNKKEKLDLERQRLKFEQALGGIKDMGGSPDLVFIIDTNKEALAIAEAKKLHVPIMAILDTNCNPDDVTFPIPANDDSQKTIKLLCRLISDAIISGIKENMVESGVDISKIEDENILKAKEKVAEKKAEDKKNAAKKPAAKKPLAKKSSEKPSEKKVKSDKKPANKAVTKEVSAKKESVKEDSVKESAKDDSTKEESK